MQATRGLIIFLACVTVRLSAYAQGGGPENERWNATPNDINNLLKEVKELLDIHYEMEIKDMSEVSSDPEQNPIVYYSGHYNFSFTPGQRAKLRQYLLNGGMLILNTGLGSAPFYRSAKSELEAIFPEVPLQRLSSDHPLFHAHYDLDHVQYSPGVYKTGYHGDEPWVDGITINCRTVAIISRFGLAVGWDGGEVRPQYAAYMPESAIKLGVNIMAYASAMRAWAKETAGMMKFVDAREPSTDKINLVQVIYDGEWKTRHAGLSVLLKTFNAKTEIPVRFGMRELKLTDPGIFDAPLLYITGHENFRLRDAEAAQLRKYILNGGFLFAEACCGRKGFDLSFRQQMRTIFPEYPMKPIPGGSSLFLIPNRITTLGATPALAAQLSSAIEPRLLGIEVEGHYGIVYSPFGLAGGWEMTPSPYAHGYDTHGALLLGQNILMYAVTQ